MKQNGNFREMLKNLAIATRTVINNFSPCSDSDEGEEINSFNIVGKRMLHGITILSINPPKVRIPQCCPKSFSSATLKELKVTEWLLKEMPSFIDNMTVDPW